jgi:hypothetical protein
MSDRLPTRWYDGGRVVDTYRKVFTEPGAPDEAYLYVYNTMETVLRWPRNRKDAPDHRLCHDGKHFTLIPAFFHTISTLAQEGRSFGVVICSHVRFRHRGCDGCHQCVCRGQVP